MSETQLREMVYGRCSRAKSMPTKRIAWDSSDTSSRTTSLLALRSPSGRQLAVGSNPCARIGQARHQRGPHRATSRGLATPRDCAVRMLLARTILPRAWTRWPTGVHPGSSES